MIFSGLSEERVHVAPGIRLRLGGAGRVITADPRAWYRQDPTTMGDENYDDLEGAIGDPDTVRGMVAHVLDRFPSRA